MTDGLVRDDLIALLERLGDDSDEEVLNAARQLHARVAAVDLAWGDLLVPDTGGSPTVDPSPTAPVRAASPAPTPAGGEDAQSVALIDEMLARPGISDDFRGELEDYKTDIANGEFEERDHRYIRALHERLS